MHAWSIVAGRSVPGSFVLLYRTTRHRHSGALRNGWGVATRGRARAPRACGLVARETALQEDGGAVTLWRCCAIASESQLTHRAPNVSRGRLTGVELASAWQEERMAAHAQDDGFPAQEDPSKAAPGARGPAAREEGSAALTKEREAKASGWPARQLWEPELSSERCALGQHLIPRWTSVGPRPVTFRSGMEAHLAMGFLWFHDPVPAGGGRHIALGPGAWAD